jgi:hypothetical protein
MQELADKIARTRDAEGYLDPMSSIHEYALGRFSCLISQNRLFVPFFCYPVIALIFCKFLTLKIKINAPIATGLF